MKSSFPVPPSPRVFAPGISIVEQEFRAQFDAVEDRILHHCDRPMIEMAILAFLNHAQGPTTAGIAKAMGIGSVAAGVHLRNLQAFGRAWCHSCGETEESWHISNTGREYLRTHHDWQKN
jgi:hypothetical protein